MAMSVSVLFALFVEKGYDCSAVRRRGGGGR